jgi:hypothetical protein
MALWSIIEWLVLHVLLAIAARAGVSSRMPCEEDVDRHMPLASGFTFKGGLHCNMEAIDVCKCCVLSLQYSQHSGTHLWLQMQRGMQYAKDPCGRRHRSETASRWEQHDDNADDDAAEDSFGISEQQNIISLCVSACCNHVACSSTCAVSAFGIIQQLSNAKCIYETSCWQAP